MMHSGRALPNNYMHQMNPHLLAANTLMMPPYDKIFGNDLLSPIGLFRHGEQHLDSPMGPDIIHKSSSN